MKMIKVIAISLFVLLLFVSAYPSLAQSAGVDFELAVVEYQRSHTTAAAEKVIKLAAALERLPSIPEEARRYFVRGAALFKDANSPDDFTQVLDEFQQATDLAPWWPEARYNWALAYEAVGDYAKALDHLNLYLLFKLPDAEARAAQDKIYALEAKQEKAAKDTSPKAGKTPMDGSKENEWLAGLDGAVYQLDFPDKMLQKKMQYYATFRIRGKEVSWEMGARNDDGTWWRQMARATIEDHTFRLVSVNNTASIANDDVCVISDDGNTITRTANHGEIMGTSVDIYRRE
jgi:tetratricopeptide (TPR) repeat protein